MRKAFVVLSVVALTTTFYSCFKNPVTGRKSLSLVDEGSMQSLASQQYQSFLDTNKTVQGTKDYEMVKRVGQRMQAAVSQYLQSIGKLNLIDGYKWEFNLVEKNEANAFCMPGGKVVVYTGILPICQNESGLAVVMGHEIAHAVARHGSERMSDQMAAQGVGVLLSAYMASKPQLAQSMFNTLYPVAAHGTMLAYSRAQESEADHMGLIFMAYAGYNPNEAVSFWQRMAAGNPSNPGLIERLMRTHPVDSKRIADIKAELPEAMKYYKPQ